jgi:hypothetical protein
MYAACSKYKQAHRFLSVQLFQNYDVDEFLFIYKFAFLNKKFAVMSKTPADVVDKTAAPAKEKLVVQRNTWMPIVGKKRTPDDEYASFYPFLEDTNIKDLVLARLYYNEKPYLSTYGNVVSAWDAVALAASKECIAETGEPVFKKDLEGKAVHKRFDELMKFVDSHNGKVPFRSGDDDEAPPSELLQLLESSFEEKISYEKGLTEKKESQTEKARKAREAGELFRKAALGEYVRNKKTNKRLSLSSSATDDDDNNLVYNNTKNDENFVTPSGKKNVSHLASLRHLGNVAAERALAKTLKEENKKAKLEAWKEIKMKQVELEAQRIEMEKERMANDRLLLLQLFAEIKKQKE